MGLAPKADDKRGRPDHQRMEQELSDYISKKYSDKSQFVNHRLSPRPQADGGDEGGVFSRIKFDMKPEEMVAYLDQYVVCQEEAKAVLATKVCTHFNRARWMAGRGGKDPSDGVGLIKNNVLMIGPTGVGKTYLVKLIAAKLGVPFVKGDATKFSETGYVGGDVEDLIRDLVHEADDDIELAEYGIIYLDEIDKIAASHSLVGPDVSRAGVQRALLKPMEETEVDLKVPHDPISQIQAIEAYRKTGKRERRTVNTRHILFIMSGAFNELPEIIRRRINKKSVGFTSDVREKGADEEYFRQLTSQDLVAFGFENEFVGRIPVHVTLDKLSAEDLHQILRNPNNPVIISKKRDFASYGIELAFEDAALEKMAHMAADMQTGARALVSVVERTLLPFERRLPSTDISSLVVTPELVAGPAAELELVLAEPDSPQRRQRMEEAAQAERMEILRMIARREPMYGERLDGRALTPARMDLIADEYYRAGMSLGAAFDAVLDRLDQVRDFEASFYQRYSLGIRFTEAAEVAILAGAAAQQAPVDEHLARLSQVLEPGLRLARDRTGKEHFELPEKAVLDTEEYLRNLFQEHYQSTLGEVDE